MWRSWIALPRNHCVLDYRRSSELSSGSRRTNVIDMYAQIAPGREKYRKGRNEEDRPIRNVRDNIQIRKGKEKERVWARRAPCSPDHEARLSTWQPKVAGMAFAFPRWSVVPAWHRVRPVGTVCAQWARSSICHTFVVCLNLAPIPGTILCPRDFFYVQWAWSVLTRQHWSAVVFLSTTIHQA